MAIESDLFKIYIDRLSRGQEETIEQVLSPETLLENEEELTFDAPIELKGEAYCTQEELILHLNVMTSATLPCSICNEPAQVEVKIEDLYHAEPLEKIKSGVFDFKEIVREAILLEIPPFTECGGGTCPRRKELKKYFKKDSAEDHVYRPFADLE